MDTMRKIMFYVLLVAFASVAFTQAAGNRVIIPEEDLDFEANEDFTGVTITRARWMVDDDNGLLRKYKGKSIELPSEIQGIPVTAIGNKAFSYESEHFSLYNNLNTTGIQEIYLPNSIRRIEFDAFAYIDAKTVRLPDGLEYIGSHAFYKSGIVSVSIPSSVRTIVANAFAGCRSLEEVVLSEGIEEIADEMFRDSGLRSVHIPESVRIIGNRAFSECSALESVEFPEQVDFIGDEAFKLTGIKRLSLPTRAFIGEYAFLDCDELETVDIPDGASYTGKRTCTLWDIIKGVKFKRNLALQKKLKDVPVLWAVNPHPEEIR